VAKVYLETSFFSAMVSRRTDPRTAGWRVTSRDWWANQTHHHDLFISAEVVRELSAPDFPDSDDALALLGGLAALDLTDEVIDLAGLLVSERLMPGPATGGDAFHIACAIIHRMDYVLTWNVKHLANPNKRTHLGIVCMRLGLSVPTLVTPDLLQLEDDDDE
jgi:hypothetical protein